MLTESSSWSKRLFPRSKQRVIELTWLHRRRFKERIIKLFRFLLCRFKQGVIKLFGSLNGFRHARTICPHVCCVLSACAVDKHNVDNVKIAPIFIKDLKLIIFSLSNFVRVQPYVHFPQALGHYIDEGYRTATPTARYFACL